MLEGEKPASSLRLFLKDRLLVFLFGLALLVNLGCAWLLYSKFHALSEFVPLHYNIYFGIDLFGPWYQIMVMPLSGLVFLLVNTTLSIILYVRVKLVSYLLMVTLVLCELVLLAAGWLIVKELVR